MEDPENMSDAFAEPPIADLEGDTSSSPVIPAVDRVIYIAGDYGDYYRITDADLKASYLVKASDPNLAKLDILTGQGVAYSGIDLEHAQALRGQQRYSDAGMWARCKRSVHFVNLRVLMTSMPIGCSADEKPPKDPSWDPSSDDPNGSWPVED